MTRLPSARTGLTRHVLQSDPDLAYLLHVPQTQAAEPRLVVSIHGAARNVDVHARLLCAYADMYGAVLVVPRFSATHYGDYQRLGRIGRGRRADLALHRIVDDVAARTGVSADRFHLFGFSAGAQFAHRYVMAYPHRVVFAVLANAGRYTLPDPTRRFPGGVAATRKLPGLHFDPEGFLRVPMKVFVGAIDPGAPTLPRRNRRHHATSRALRAERARQWVAAMREVGRASGMDPAIAYEELPERLRSFRSSVLRAGLAERAFDAMFGPPRTAVPLPPPTEPSTP